MDLSAELKELRKQLYTYRYKSLELERQLRTHCRAFHQTLEAERQNGVDDPSLLLTNAFENTSASFFSVFSNSLVMEIIASHLPVQDLLSCRLVCKPWASDMAQYLTKRKALVVAYEDCSEAKELLKKKIQGKFVNISTLCILEIPVTSEIITDVVKNFGETLSGLKLDDCNPDAKDLFSLVKALPSLEVLSFKQTGVRRVDGSTNVPSTLDGLTSYYPSLKIVSLKKLVWEEIQPVKSLEQIINMFPRLEELELQCWSKPDPESVIGMRLDTLKHLSISCDNNFSESHFQALANLKLKLKKLTLHDISPGGRKRMRGLKTFLNSISKTLNEMDLSGSGRISEETSGSYVNQVSAFPIEFPVLRKLNIDCGLMTNLKMVDYMPVLQKLECKFQDWKGWWHLLNANGAPHVHEHLREASLGAIDSGCIAKIASSFTSVTKLEVSEDRIDDVAFRTIASAMSQITHLRITASTNRKNKKLALTDSGFTGIPLEEFPKLTRPESGGANEDYVNQLRKHPFIGDFEELYSLELTCSELSITDVAVVYGITALKRISTITLPNCKLTDASLDAFAGLRSLLVLELDKRCGVTSDGVANLRTKKKDIVLNLYSDVTSRIFS